MASRSLGQSVNVQAIKTTLFQVIPRPSLCVPHLIVPTIASLDFAKLKDSGFKALIFDKDNTITLPYQDQVHRDVADAWNECKLHYSPGQLLLVSNSAGSADDLANTSTSVEQNLGVKVLAHSHTKKPLGIEEALECLRARSGTIKNEEVVVIGDRVLTDVVYGNMGGCFTILCHQIFSEQNDNKAAVMARRWEKRLLQYLKNKNVQPPNLDKWKNVDVNGLVKQRLLASMSVY